MTGTKPGTRYPSAERQDIVDVIHGVAVPDPYRWLEDPELSETSRWQAEQDDLYRRSVSHWPLRAEFAAELDRLAAAGYCMAPAHYGDRYFYLRLAPGENLFSLISEADGVDQVCFNPLAWDPSGRTILEAWQPSWQGDLVAIQLSVDGTEDCQLLVLDASSGRVVDGPIDRVRKSAIGWLPDGAGFYYVRQLPPEQCPGEYRYHRRVYLHRLGTPPELDALIFGEGRKSTEHYAVLVLPTVELLVLTASVGPRSAAIRDVWVASLADPPEQISLQTLQEQRRVRTQASPAATTSEKLYLRTDQHAPRGAVVTVPATDPTAAWNEFLPEDPTAVLLDFVVLTGPGLAEPLAVASRLRHGSAELELLALGDGGSRGFVPLPGPGLVTELTVAAGGEGIWFSYTSPDQPLIVLGFDARTGQPVDWPSSIRRVRQPCHTSKVTYHSADGTLIRMFIVSAGPEPDRPRPTILNGYGGFGAMLGPSFRPEIAAWVAAGGVFAIACLRGGGEEGAQWHRAGAGLNKQNVFDDFAAAADYLTTHGWTSSDRLGIYGSSNGGLLVGAALTQHPEKYAAAVCLAPLLDMVRYEASGRGPSWRPEYGSVADPIEFANLLQYSPYHGVRDGIDYPATLLGVFDGDSRVDQSHARKMCAALQSATTGDRPIVLRTEAGVGHGARAVSSATGLLAECLSFFAAHLAW